MCHLVACRVSCFPCPPGAGGVTLPENGTLVCYNYHWDNSVYGSCYETMNNAMRCCAHEMGTTQCKNEVKCYRRVLAPTSYERYEVKHAPT